MMHIKFNARMMKRPGAILLVVLLALQSCDEKGETEPEPVAFLTVTLGANYYIHEDMWVFATDETGKVLDAGPVEAGSSLVLEALFPPQSINLTTYYKGGGSPVSHMFYTYAGINRGDEITLERAPSSTFLPSVAGKATINIPNCNRYSFFVLSDGHTYSQFATQDNTILDVSVDLRQDPCNILISSHVAMDKPVYGWVENVTNAGEYTIDFNSLSPFPKTLSVLFSESMSALVIARKAGVGSTGYVMTNRGFSTISPDPMLAKFGYLDGFDEYSLFVASTNAMSTYYRTTYYKNQGATLPEEITFPDNSLIIENPMIGNFSFNYSSTYAHRSHYWRQDATDHTIHWRVYTDKPTTPLITELPEALITKYPFLSVSNLTYSQSEFFKYEDGYTYAQFLRDIFQGISPSHREFFGDSFQQK